MDVHDTSLVSRTSPIIPGMVITIEPGKASKKIKSPFLNPPHDDMKRLTNSER